MNAYVCVFGCAGVWSFVDAEEGNARSSLAYFAAELKDIPTKVTFGSLSDALGKLRPGAN